MNTFAVAFNLGVVGGGGQFFIGTHNEPLSVVAVRVSNSDNHPSEA